MSDELMTVTLTESQWEQVQGAVQGQIEKLRDEAEEMGESQGIKDQEIRNNLLEIRREYIIISQGLEYQLWGQSHE